MDDVTFGRNGCDAERWRLNVLQLRRMRWRYRGGVWCLWMLVPVTA